MVGVGVRIKNRIHPRDSFPDGLGVEIGCGVDEHDLAGKLKHDRRAGAAVAGITGAANRAVAAKRRHTHGCAAAEHRERGFHAGTFRFESLRGSFIVRWFPWPVPAAEGATGRWSLPHRPYALRRGCSAESFLRSGSGCPWSFPQSEREYRWFAERQECQPAAAPLAGASTPSAASRSE